MYLSISSFSSFLLKTKIFPKHLYYKKIKYKNKPKLVYLSPKVWRHIYLISTNAIHHTSEKRIRTRSSVIPISFNTYEIIIYSGKKWFTRKVNLWMVGFKFGEFTWNRKFALFKAKQTKKKK